MAKLVTRKHGDVLHEHSEAKRPFRESFSVVARTYGDALLQHAIDYSCVDELMDEVKEVGEILKEEKDFKKLMDSPKLTEDQKAVVMEKVFHGKINKELLGLMRLLLLKEHYDELQSVFAYFILKGKEFNNIGLARVRSALPLTEEQKSEVKAKLLATTKYKDIEIEYLVDKSLIGGMVIRIGDRVVDGSIKTKLQRLTEELEKIQLKEGEYAP